MSSAKQFLLNTFRLLLNPPVLPLDLTEKTSFLPEYAFSALLVKYFIHPKLIIYWENKAIITQFILRIEINEDNNFARVLNYNLLKVWASDKDVLFNQCFLPFGSVKDL